MLNLLTDQTHFFALRTLDSSGNESLLSNVVEATTVKDQIPPDPAAPGMTEVLTVGALELERTYFIAMRVIDGAGNESELSNVVDAFTDSNVSAK